MNHYNSLTEVQLQLLQKGTIDLNGETDPEMLDYVRESIIRLTAANSPPINILINSPGGKIKFGMGIYDLINHYNSPTTGILINYGYSMAAIILQACQKRLITDHSTILIHNPVRLKATWKDFFDAKANQAAKQVMKEDRELFIKILLARTGQTRKKIIAALNRGQEMTAPEALRFGLVDEIIKPERLSDDKTIDV